MQRTIIIFIIIISIIIVCIINTTGWHVLRNDLRELRNYQHTEQVYSVCAKFGVE
jgi:glycosylphosphatidylinositol transamidase (GPIT) subunit GPI8